MAEEGSFQEFPAYVEKSSGKSRIILVFIVIIAIVLAILIAFYVLGIKSKKTTSSVTPSQAIVTSAPVISVVPSESLSPEPSKGGITPKPSLKPSRGPSVSPVKTTQDRSALTIAVLNGSGTPGAAKGISSYLNNLGYTISSVGNADNFTYQNITVKIKTSKSGYLSLLKKDIAANSPDIPIEASTDNTISTDAQVIVGK